MAEVRNRTRGERVQCECCVCGTVFERLASHLRKSSYCSSNCYADSLKGRAPQNKGKRTIASKPCAKCGGAISGTPSEVRKKKYCGIKCMSEAFAMSVHDAFEKYVKIDDVTGCWIWTGQRRGGYGRVKDESGRLTGAHRVSYERHHGPIQNGLVIDHLCRNRACVNPDHLEPVTLEENIRRGMAGKGPRSAKHRSSISEGMLRHYADSSAREAQARRLDALRESTTRKAAAAAATRTPEYRAKRSEMMRRIWAERKAASSVDHRNGGGS
jgi:hypothetical protein